MPSFTKTWLSGLGRDENDTADNIILKWIKDKWTLTDPAPYNISTNPFGVIFGSQYLGYFDYVAYAKMEDGGRIELMSLGGRHDNYIKDVTFCFSVRNYHVSGGDEIPIQVNNVFDFVNNLVDSNPRGLQSEGMRYIKLISSRNGEQEKYGQQIYRLDFVIRCFMPKINLE